MKTFIYILLLISAGLAIGLVEECFIGAAVSALVFGAAAVFAKRRGYYDH